MSLTPTKQNSGLTLIEVMVATVIIAIGVLGAMGYRYYCALDARRADVQITAARLGYTLLESWKASGGFGPSEPENNYDPEDLAFGTDVTISAGGSTGPGGFDDLFGNYVIGANRADYYATLSYEDVSGEPRRLNVAVAWMPGNQEWDGAKYKSVRLTGYVD